MKQLRGVMSALVTPMRGGQLDLDSLRALTRFQLEAGIHGLIPCGSTGEGATLNAREHLAVLGAVAEEVAGRVPVIGGVGARSTWQAIEQAKACEQAGASHVLVVTPAYNKPTQAGLLAHFEAVAEASALPMVLYNVPGRTACDLLPAAVAILARHPRIVAIKEATGSTVRASEIRNLVGPDFSLLSGDDFTYLAFAAQGGDGCISVLANVAPERLLSLHRAVHEPNLLLAARLHHELLPLIAALFVESNPTPVKTALAWRGIIPSAELRLPLMPITSQGAEVLAAALRGCGVPIEPRAGERSTLGPSRP